VQGAKIIFESILRSFAGLPYEAIHANFTPMIHGKEDEKALLFTPRINSL
jgi:hypothetical protein